MPVVDTTTTFSNNEQITSTKLNGIMDNSSFVSGAVVTSGGLEVTAGGQMQIASSGVMATNIAAASVTQAKIGANVAGTGPVFRAYQSSSGTVAATGDTKIAFQTKQYDTDSVYSTSLSRFTATIAGYYLIYGQFSFLSLPSSAEIAVLIKKNGVITSRSPRSTAIPTRLGVTDIVYLLVGDYVELFVFNNTGSTSTGQINPEETYFSGCLIRAA